MWGLNSGYKGASGYAVEKIGNQSLKQLCVLPELECRDSGRVCGGDGAGFLNMGALL